MRHAAIINALLADGFMDIGPDDDYTLLARQAQYLHRALAEPEADCLAFLTDLRTELRSQRTRALAARADEGPMT